MRGDDVAEGQMDKKKKKKDTLEGSRERGRVFLESSGCVFKGPFTPIM